MNLKTLEISVKEPDNNGEHFIPINHEVIKNSSLTDLILFGRDLKFTEYLLQAFS
jgi:hypothetical protein